jgi:hypothetical protein
MITVWKWRCEGCKTEVETLVGQVPAECSCGAVCWLKVSERKES